MRPPTREYRHFIYDSRRWARFVARPGDVFVCTPPKTGTTWMQTIVANLLFQRGDLPAPVTEMSPWIDFRFFPIDDVLATIAAQTHRRSMKTHTPADGIPWSDDASYIVVGRDGRDAFMSFVNHVASMRPDTVAQLITSALDEGIEMDGPPPPDDIHEFFAGWLADGRFFDFIASYWQHRDAPNVLFVHYDEMKADLDATMRRVAAFLDIAVDEALWAETVRRCTFDYMKSHPEQVGSFGDFFVGGADAFFFKGTNGRWRDVLTADELAAYARRANALLPADARTWLDRATV